MINALLLGVRAWQGLPIVEGDGPGPPVPPGLSGLLAATDERFCADSNGDGGVDISDAITILNYLFTGQGCAPYCIAGGVSIDGFVTRIAELEGLLTRGCTDPGAMNYEPCADLSDGSCRYAGCTNPEADNFDPNANVDDGSCQYPGCTDSTAGNFDPNANADDLSCLYLGCTDDTALNFDPSANLDDGACCFSLEECLLDGLTLLGTQPATGLEEYVQDLTGIEFVLLPGGDFDMGSPAEGESPVHTVTLRPFLIAKYEVTQAQYAQVMEDHPNLPASPLLATPSFFDGTSDAQGNPIDPPFDGDQLPVEQVSWFDLKHPDGFLARTGLSLPSEAQWEYACRGGTTTEFSFDGDHCIIDGGDGCNLCLIAPCEPADDFMWWCDNSRDWTCSGGGPVTRVTHPVGEKQPNPFGLHDMHGNVFEWCEDWWDSGFYSYAVAAGPDPVALAGSSSSEVFEFGLRVVRGGGYLSPSGNCRSTGRNPARPIGRGGGFRPVRAMPTVPRGRCGPPGCTDPDARNYDPCAKLDAGTCVYDPEPVIPEEFTSLGENPQGYDEYTLGETGIVFVYLPGVFTMRPFLIAKNEITQSQYAAVMADHATLSSSPSFFDGTSDFQGNPIDPPLDSDQLPVEQVSWDDLQSADGFLARTGLEFPSSLQWQYACRGGTTTDFSFGVDSVGGVCGESDSARPGSVDYMWWCVNAGGISHPVGAKLPNPFGLNDMHGNVAEWHDDLWMSGFLPRLHRGGSWRDAGSQCGVDRYGKDDPSFRDSTIGFRPILPLP
jgi:formylglycine-generating enzyme required for sulfatase activity